MNNYGDESESQISNTDPDSDAVGVDSKGVRIAGNDRTEEVGKIELDTS